jgi:acyl-CoA synthetase (AMP-forming)/AMP-acid ligase II
VSSVLRHLSAYLAETAARHAGRPAVVDADGTVVTYGDLDEAVRRVAGHLATHGIGVGDRVGVMMPKSIEAVTAIYGVLTCGAAYVPLDPSAPPERGGIILDDCGVEALFVHESVASLLDRWEPRVRPRAVVVVGDRQGSLSAIETRAVLSNGALRRSSPSQTTGLRATHHSTSTSPHSTSMWESRRGRAFT